MRRILFALLFFFAAAPSFAALADVDRAAVRKVMDRYVEAWLAGDEAGVMQQLTKDSVLIPGEKPPYVGAAAIRAYWWPPNAPKFTLDRFTSNVDVIEGAGDVAVVRGTQVLEWTTGGERWRTRGNFMTMLRKTANGWRIATQMAANAPNEKVP